ncbi:uncharacterized protein LOC111433123 [Cucurbita moschata]|uniref:Uncharacterized protein LOC111433123 n=1 Tax=Cucurbita moschata TaxID=3662 RepID=A0A6J1EDA8_CUCMO|nr:uncharacterized protein LOC111433123 [Cucurbita moschata]
MVSNMIPEEVEQNEDIVLRLNKLVMEDSDPEFKKEQDDRSLPKIQEENAEDLDNDASLSRNGIKKNPINDDEEESNRSSLADLQVLLPTKEKEKKGENKEESVAESHEMKIATKKLEEESFDPFDSSLDTLEALEKIVLEYYEFLNYALRILKKGISVNQNTDSQ